MAQHQPFSYVATQLAQPAQQGQGPVFTTSDPSILVGPSSYMRQVFGSAPDNQADDELWPFGLAQDQDGSIRTSVAKAQLVLMGGLLVTASAARLKLGALVKLEKLALCDLVLELLVGAAFRGRRQKMLAAQELLRAAAVRLEAGDVVPRQQLQQADMDEGLYVNPATNLATPMSMAAFVEAGMLANATEFFTLTVPCQGIHLAVSRVINHAHLPPNPALMAAEQLLRARAGADAAADFLISPAAT